MSYPVSYEDLFGQILQLNLLGVWHKIKIIDVDSCLITYRFIDSKQTYSMTYDCMFERLKNNKIRLNSPSLFEDKIE